MKYLVFITTNLKTN
jgi:hypothetical protein